MNGRGWMLSLVTGVVMIGIGLFVAFRPLWTHNAVLTGARWLDFALAAASLLRGVFNIRMAMARRRRRMGTVG